MKNAQKFVFVSLLVVIALQFSSFSKLKTLWGLAFGSASKTTAASKTTPPTVQA